MFQSIAITVMQFVGNCKMFIGNSDGTVEMRTALNNQAVKSNIIFTEPENSA